MTAVTPLRFAMIGAGFWARYQLSAWRELPGARCVAVCDRAGDRAAALARDLGVDADAVFTDVGALLDRVSPDFVDIVTDVSTHAPFAHLAIDRGIPAITQKPMAHSLAAAEAMVAHSHRTGVPLFVHENWRWQRPIRAVRRLLDERAVGRVFRATIDMISGFPVFENQPALAELDQFIIADLGSHTLDAARFLFGNPASLYCRTARVHTHIRGEDVATVVLAYPPDHALPRGRPAPADDHAARANDRAAQANDRAARANNEAARADNRAAPAASPTEPPADGGIAAPDLTVMVRMAYAGNAVERECFPQTLMFIEGSAGTIELTPDYTLRLTTAAGTRVYREPPVVYPWVDPRYAVVQSSIVDCNANLLAGLRRHVGDRAHSAPGSAASRAHPTPLAETTAADNLQTVRLVYAAYDSAAGGRAITLPG